MKKQIPLMDNNKSLKLKKLKYKYEIRIANRMKDLSKYLSEELKNRHFNT